MKRMMFVLLIALFAISAMGNGTVRVYTGNGSWLYSYSEWPSPTTYPAVNVVQYNDGSSPNNPWDRRIPPSVPENSGPPRPWEKLYEQTPLADGLWIGMQEAGWDTSGSFATETLWFYSPTFQLQENISRATIWLSADDVIDFALLRDMTTNTTYFMPCVPVNSFTNFVRFDLTDFFADKPYSPQGYRMEFRVRNEQPHYTGMISYMSYDYGKPREYSYSISDWGFRFLSLPFRPTDPTATLQSLFPHMIAAHWFNWETGSWQTLDHTAPLTGTLGDIVRTYTIRLYYASPSIHNTTIEGYPIFEQRYLDITTNNELYLGSINCDCKTPGMIGYVPFYLSQPDDLWWDKITGTAGWSYYRTSSSTSWSTPTQQIRPKWAYYSIPHPSCPSCADPCLPYHLDLINYVCSWPTMSSTEEECYSTSGVFEPEYEGLILDPTLSEDEITIFQRIVDSLYSFIDIPDSLEICERFPDLCGEYYLEKRSEDRIQRPNLNLSAHPTPFNAEVSISVTIPYDDYLTVSIYNSSGQLVKILYENEISAGQHSFVWNGLDSKQSEVSSGQYLVRVTSRNEIMTEKVILVK